MDFSSSADHEAIREGIRRICADFPDEYWAAKDEAHEFPWEFYNALAAGGWVGIALPEEFGGLGLSCLSHCLLLEVFTEAGVGTMVTRN